jgi:hypothetical protein
MINIGKGTLAVLTIGLTVVAQVAHAGFDSFVIRGTPTVTEPVAGQYEFVIAASGQKGGLGSNDMNGLALSSLQSITITRLDDVTRFTAGSGPAVGPYLNFWITDGLGRFAVVANEPSNPAFQPLFVNKTYDLSFADLSNQAAKIFEVTDRSWLPNAGVGLTFADLGSFVVQAPTVAQLTAGWAGLGSGAPRKLGTNEAYGANWVFGDTLSNYVSGDPGYIVDNATLQAGGSVPDVGSTAGLMAIAFATVVALRRKFARS